MGTGRKLAPLKITTEESYLFIHEAYSEAMGGARWAASCEAIETAEGRTLAFSEQILAILKGAFQSEKVPSFDSILWMLYHLGCDAKGMAWMEPLRSAWTRTRNVSGRSEHLGRWIGEICKAIPAPAHTPSFEKVKLALRNRSLSTRPFPSDMVEIPPLDPAALELHLEKILKPWTQERFLHWLKFGSAPTGAAETIREKVETLPEKIAAIMQMAWQRPRLSGAVSLVPMLDGALTFPPRRQTPRSLNLGGFAEIATKGDLSRLLISQLALDPDEFLRRYIEGELLYFQKEKPHEKAKPERWLVLDQGIRTWGSVRLALCGAALSLLARTLSKGFPCRLQATSRDDLLVAATQSSAELVDALEASDFSSSPFPSLAKVIREVDPEGPGREIVLLTHSSTLKDPQMGVLARNLPAGDRLFCLGVDEHGDAELWEQEMLSARSLVRFRIDLEGAEKIRVALQGSTVSEGSASSQWTGQVEPYPFLFGPGLIGDLHTMGFSADGEWLVVAGRDRILQAIQVEDGKIEFLPRAYLNGKLFHDVEEILGVKDGVVICGTMEVTPEWVASMNSSNEDEVGHSANDALLATSPSFRMYFAAHYNRFKRQVRLFPFSPFSAQTQWVAFPDLHCVVLVEPSQSIALDLAGSLVDQTLGQPFASNRANEAVKRVKEGKWQKTRIPVVGSKDSLHQANDKSTLVRRTGNAISVQNSPIPWETFEPKQEGKPLLGGQAIEQIALAGEVLALSLMQTSERKIVLFRAPRGEILQEYSYRSSFRGFCLSSDGMRMARRIGKSQIVVHETLGERDNIATVMGARLHPNITAQFSVDPFRVTLQVSGTIHRFELLDGILIHSLARNEDPPPKAMNDLQTAEGRWNYDPARFHAKPCALGAYFLRDRWGQALLVDHRGELVAAWMIRRYSAAAWIPGGIYWGDPALIGGPPTPKAEQLIGQALSRFVEKTQP